MYTANSLIEETLLFDRWIGIDRYTSCNRLVMSAAVLEIHLAICLVIGIVNSEAIAC